MKQLKDYLHLYLGCKVKVSVGQPDDILCGMNINTSYVKLLRNQSVLINHVKPILRPLSDLNGQEEVEYLKFQATNSKMGNIQRSAESTKWFLSKQFDLFGLIEAGLAIDKTKL